MMSNEPQNLTPEATEGGVAAEHPRPQALPLLVGPATAQEHNTLKAAIFPFACWRVEDLRFEFGSSFVRPEIASEMALLARLVRAHPGAPASVFGHADPVGSDDLNKKLSGRRAAAIYAMLTRNTDVWEDLYKQTAKFTSPLSSDDWGLKSIEAMLKALGHDPGPIDGQMDDRTREAVKTFQRANGLSADGDPGPQTRARLFLAYMDKHCRDEANGPFKMETTDFLARGADRAGKGDYQGCGEFNPVLMFSREEDERFRQARDHTERNAANAPNRRVVVFLFRPGSRVSAEKWRCPRAKEGVEGCRGRFWSDAAQRRSFQEQRRLQEETKDTFACRFYDRLANASPCERAVALTEKGIFYLEFFDDLKLPDEAALVVEGLEEPFRAPAREHFDAQRGVYCFELRHPVPGALCRATLETPRSSVVLFENVDLDAWIQRALRSNSEPPIPIQVPRDFVSHVLEMEDESIDDPIPDAEDGDWDFAPEAPEVEPLTDNGAGGVVEVEIEFDPRGEN